MKKILCTVIFLTVVFTGKASVNWMDSLEEAKKLSKIMNKPILVDFWATWCGPCKQMDSDVWSKEEIKQLIKYYIPVKIDIDSHQHLARTYSIKGIPNVLILDSWGNKLYQSVGYKHKGRVKELLKSFSVNMLFINRAMGILEKSKKNGNSNLRVAQKYQDAILVLKGEAKKSFVKQSNSYLKKAQKKFGRKILAKTKQKIELLKLLNKAYLSRTKSTLNKIDKMKVEEIDESNKSLLSFIRFYCLKENGDSEESSKELRNLKTIGGGYLKKAEYILTLE